MEESRNLGVKSSVDVFNNGAFEVLIFEDRRSFGLSKECKRTAETLEKEFSAVGNIKFVKENYRFDERDQEGFRFEVFNSLHKDKELQNNVIDAFDKANINYKDTPLYHVKKQLDENDLELAKDKAVIGLDNFSIIPIERKENMYGVVFEMSEIFHKGSLEECKKDMLKELNSYENHRQESLNADNSESGGKKYRAEDRVAVVNGEVIKETENVKNTNSRELYYEMHILNSEIKKATLENNHSEEDYEKQHNRIKEYHLLKEFTHAVDNKDMESIKKLSGEWDLNKEHLIKHINTHQNLDEGEKKQFSFIINQEKELAKIPFVKEDSTGEYVLKSVDEEDASRILALSNRNNKLFYRDYTDTMGEDHEILTKEGIAFAKENKIHLESLGRIDYSEKEAYYRNILNTSEIKEKLIDQSTISFINEKIPVGSPDKEVFVLLAEDTKINNGFAWSNVQYSQSGALKEYISIKELKDDFDKFSVFIMKEKNVTGYYENTEELITNTKKEGRDITKDFNTLILENRSLDNKEKPINQLTEAMEAKNDVYAGSVNKTFTREGDPTEKLYHVDLKKEVISSAKVDEFGNVKIHIRPFERDFPGIDGKQTKKIEYEAIMNPKDSTNTEAIISLKKEKFLQINEMQLNDGTKVVPITVANRNPEMAKRDDLSVYENKIRTGMDEKEYRKALEDKNYIGTGWTQKSEHLLLKQTQINKDELKKSIDDNNPVRTVAIIQRGGSKLLTKDVLDEVGKAKEKHGEKFDERIEKYINAVVSKKQKENKISM